MTIRLQRLLKRPQEGTYRPMTNILIYELIITQRATVQAFVRSSFGVAFVRFVSFGETLTATLSLEKRNRLCHSTQSLFAGNDKWTPMLQRSQHVR